MPFRNLAFEDEDERTQRAAPELSERIHRTDDLDRSVRAHHHTLGSGKNQAASGSRMLAAEQAIASLATGAGVVLTFTFASPINTWIANHNLHTKGCTVKAFSPSDDLLMVEIDYNSIDQVQASWYYPTAGYLLIST